MAKIKINTRVTVDGKPGEVVAVRRKATSRGHLEYQIKLDGDYIHSEWFDLSSLLREDGKLVKDKSTLARLIGELRRIKKEYRRIVEDTEAMGLDKLNHEETEDYGVYKGKLEILEVVIKRLKKIKK